MLIWLEQPNFTPDPHWRQRAPCIDVRYGLWSLPRWSRLGYLRGSISDFFGSKIGCFQEEMAIELPKHGDLVITYGDYWGFNVSKKIGQVGFLCDTKGIRPVKRVRAIPRKHLPNHGFGRKPSATGVYFTINPLDCLDLINMANEGKHTW